jgi:hypothetical protein
LERGAGGVCTHGAGTGGAEQAELAILTGLEV